MSEIGEGSKRKLERRRGLEADGMARLNETSQVNKVSSSQTLCCVMSQEKKLN